MSAGAGPIGVPINDPATAAPVVDIRGLSKRYGDFDAVANLELQVPPGQLFALLGPNGAGKTTTIRMLMGILRPTSGSALIAGFDCFRDRVLACFGNRHVGVLGAVEGATAIGRGSARGGPLGQGQTREDLTILAAGAERIGQSG